MAMIDADEANNQTKGRARSRAMLLSANEVAELLGVSLAFVRKLDSSGRLPRAIRLGRTVRWSLRTLENWLAVGAPPRERWESMQ